MTGGPALSACRDDLADRFGRRVDALGVVERRVVIAGEPVTFRFAGDRLIDDITAAFAALGAVDTNNMIPASIGDGKYTLADAAKTMTWTFPCAIDGAAFDEFNTCIVMDDNYENVER